MSDKKIGFIGYGAMAVHMGTNLQKAGYDVVAFTPSGKAAGKPSNVPMLPSPRAVAEQVDIIILCVPDDHAENKTLEGDNGLLAGLRKGQLILDTSTVSPLQADYLARLAQERGVQIMDAPMSGSTPEAERGELIMLVGGDEATFKRAQPILDIIGRLSIHTGASGSASRLKLVVNGVMGATLNVIAEGVAYGLSEGLDRDTLLAALQEVAVVSPHHKRKLQMARNKSYPSTFPTRLMNKDMGLLLDAGRRTGVAMPAMAVAAQNLARSNRHHRDEDYAALINQMEEDVANTTS
ncbi:NAD-binding protein [Saccharibacter sp. 17.LH.SD]|uniref:NAD(P)-dependent oxidoreductase n=1 Tax=Saccharibacter sp. 17.LH.SD TaxID=2689393 RepID=UPI00136A0599|nr:NAD(P)-dependent oxidoreductase [Saccharibacter sp. 17.LH.SD]MXV44080.1 NAD-binding protein [Saccharibacter sp. 17.LH.SD]